MNQIFSSYTAVAYFSAVEARSECDAVASSPGEDMATELESINTGVFHPYYPDLLALAAGNSVSLVNTGTGRQLASISTGPLSGIAWLHPQRRLFSYMGCPGVVGPAIFDDPSFLLFFTEGENSVSILNVSEIVRKVHAAGEHGGTQDAQASAIPVGVVYKLPMPYPVTDIVSQSVVNKVSISARVPAAIQHDGTDLAYRTIFNSSYQTSESIQAGYMSFAVIMQSVVVIVSLLPPVDGSLQPPDAWCKMQRLQRQGSEAVGPHSSAPGQFSGPSFPYKVRMLEFRVSAASLNTRISFRFSPTNPNIFYALSGPLLFLGQLCLQEAGSDERVLMERRREAHFNSSFPHTDVRVTLALTEAEKQQLFARTYVSASEVCAYNNMQWKDCYNFMHYFPASDGLLAHPQQLFLSDDGMVCAICGHTKIVIFHTDTREASAVLLWPDSSAVGDVQTFVRLGETQTARGELDSLMGMTEPRGKADPAHSPSQSAPGVSPNAEVPSSEQSPAETTSHATASSEADAHAGEDLPQGDTDSDSEVADLDFGENPFTARSSTDDPNELYTAESFASSVSASLVTDDETAITSNRGALSPEEVEILSPYSLVTHLRSSSRAQPALDLVAHYPHLRSVFLEMAAAQKEHASSRRADTSQPAKIGGPSTMRAANVSGTRGALATSTTPTTFIGPSGAQETSFKSFASLALRQTISFSPDGRYLIASSTNGVGELVAWDLGQVNDAHRYYSQMRTNAGLQRSLGTTRPIPAITGHLLPFSFLEQNSLERRTFASFVPGTRLFVLSRGPMVVILCPLLAPHQGN